MNKIISILCFILLSIPSFAQLNYDDLNDSQVIRALKGDISYLSSAKLEGRKAGSKGEQLASKYIYDRLKSYGLDLLSDSTGNVFSICRDNGDTIVSQNVVAIVEGADKTLKNQYIVVGARLDNGGVNILNINGKNNRQIYYGANGNASGLALMIQLAKMVKLNALHFGRSIVFVAFGASNQAYAGAWYFLNKSFAFKDKIDAMINLDMLGTGADDFIAYTSNNKDLNVLVDLMKKDLQPCYPILTTQEPYPSDSRAFYSSKIPSIYFTTGKYPQYNTDRDVKDIINYGDMERELEYIYNFTEALANQDVAPKFMSSNKDASDEKVYKYSDCHQLPSFMGHTDPRWFLQNWVYQYQKYPDEAVSKGVQGKVGIGFIIDKKGRVTDVHITKPVDPLLDNEAKRIVEASPNWKPGLIGGKKVNTYLELIIEFRLNKNK